ASAFRSDVTVFRLKARSRPKTGSESAFMRRNACTQSRRLIARRSQVQILPRLLHKRPALRGSSVSGRGMYPFQVTRACPRKLSDGRSGLSRIQQTMNEFDPRTRSGL